MTGSTRMHRDPLWRWCRAPIALLLVAATMGLVAVASAGSQVLPPGVDGDCAGEVPVVVASDVAAQSDLYSAATLAGVLDTDCIVLAGARDAPMGSAQVARLDAAEEEGWIVGGEAAVPTAKVAGRSLRRLDGVDRWHTARLAGAVAADPDGDVAALITKTAPVAGSVRGTSVMVDGVEVLLPPGIDSDCAGQVPIVVAVDADAQADLYSAATLAGVLDTTCIVLAGARGEAMTLAQRERLFAADGDGWIVGGEAAVPPAKTAGYHLARQGGTDRWHTARLIGRVTATQSGTTNNDSAERGPAVREARLSGGTGGGFARRSNGSSNSSRSRTSRVPSSSGGGGRVSPVDGSVRAALDANAEAAAACGDVDCIFARAAERRQVVIDELTAKINAGEYGVGDDDVLRGPAGFEIDVSACPADWDNTAGITDNVVRIGHTTALSGSLAAYGNIAIGWENLLDWMNENDPLTLQDGTTRDVVLVVRDDAYVAANTIEFVDELIERENVFSILTLGSPNTLGTYVTINEECIPHPFVMSGHPAWGDPVNHPWTTGLQMSYSTEATLWGEWIRSNLAEQLPVVVAGLVMDNDFGLAYESAFNNWAEENSEVVSRFEAVRHDPAQWTITNEISTIRAADPNVFISMTAGNACLLAVQEAGSSGLNDIVEASFAPSVCKGIEAYMKPAGDAGDGWWIVGGGVKDTSDPAYITEPFISWLNDNLDEAGLDSSISLYGTGYWYGYPYVESLRIAAALPGGLTRTNFILAVRSADLYHPMHLPGVNFNFNGSADAYAVEGSDFSRYDASNHTWYIDNVIDVSGHTPNCAWGESGCQRSRPVNVRTPSTPTWTTVPPSNAAAGGTNRPATAEGSRRPSSGGGGSRSPSGGGADSRMPSVWADAGDANAAAAARCADVDCVFRLAAQRRAGIVAELTAKINAGEYGVGDDGILRGPAGFEIDINSCPRDWSDTTGITVTEVRIGHTTAQSGALAAYGNIAVGWENYLDWVNQNDPLMVDGSPRDMVLVIKDDGYVAANTIEFVDDLIDRENVFSILTLGSPNTLATYDTINEECIPHPFVMSGHPAWGDPVNHPWTTGLQLRYSTEAILWGQWIRQNLADQLPVVVAGLVMDNDFGLAYELGFEHWAEANPEVVSSFEAVRHDPAAGTITNEMSRIKRADPDVFISMTAGNACLLAVQEADSSGLNDDIDAAFAPSECKGIEAYMKPAGDAGDGWWVVGGGVKDTSDPNHIREPFVSWLNDNLDAAGLDSSISLYGTGYWYGYPYVESLRIAAALPGGLTRTNFILAVRSMDLYHPMLLDGVKFELGGAVDAYAVEGSDYSQYDASVHRWNIISTVDVNGQTPNCVWGEGGCG